MDATIVQLEAKVARRREDAELLRKQNKIMQCRCECLESVRKTVKAQHSVTIAQHLERIRDLQNVQEEIDERKAVLSALVDARKRTSCNQLQQDHVATRLRAVIEEEEDENEQFELTMQRELERVKHKQEGDQRFQCLLERHNALQQRHIDDASTIQQLEVRN
ncbi:hypothetical protein ABG067_004056 [Albugo candida]